MTAATRPGLPLRRDASTARDASAAREPAAREPAARHHAKVDRVAAALRAHAARARAGDARPVSLRKKAVSHQVPKRDDKRHTDDKIDLTDLDEILAIDPVARTCTAEPGVTFAALVDATLAYGLVPTVVPELRTITVGGAVSGCSLESMSFRYGGFHDSCLEYEVVTGRGEILRCTPDEDPLVFQMMHGSFGTLGILSKLVFRLVPAKPFVHVRYETYATLAEYLAAIERHFRYDRGVTNVHPRSFLGRLLLGPFLGSSTLLRIAERLRRLVLPREDGARRPDVIVDLFIPMSRLPGFMQWYRQTIDFFPLWCVPYKRVRDYEWIAPNVFEGLDDELFVDLAIYGLRQPEGRNLYREIEEALPRFHALKTLISYNYYDERELWQTWNEPNYRAVKARTDPDGVFRDLFTKTCRAARGLD